MDKKYKILIGIFAVVILAIAFVIIGNAKTTAAITLTNSDKNKTAELQTINFRLPIPMNEAEFTDFYVAQELGFYKEEGLDLKINLGSPELNPIKMVSSGADDFGLLGGPDTLIVARSKNIPLKAIAVLHKNSNLPILITLKSSGITTVEQLEGKKIGFNYGHISTDVLRTLFKKEDINVQEVDIGMNYNPLIAGQIDASWGFMFTAAINLPAKGIEINIINPSEYGIPVHGYTIFTRDDLIKNNPELVDKFWKATKKGIEYTSTHPDEALDIIMKYIPDGNRSLELQRLTLHNKLKSNANGLEAGYMDNHMFQETYDRLKEEKVLANDFNVSDVFTTKFLN